MWTLQGFLTAVGSSCLFGCTFKIVCGCSIGEVTRVYNFGGIPQAKMNQAIQEDEAGTTVESDCLQN